MFHFITCHSIIQPFALVNRARLYSKCYTLDKVGNKTHVNNSILPTNIQSLKIHTRNWKRMQNSQWHTNRMIKTTCDKTQPNAKRRIQYQFSLPGSQLGFLIHRLLNGHGLELQSCMGYDRWWRKFSASYGRSAEVTKKFRQSSRTSLNFCEHGLPSISSYVCYKFLLLYDTTQPVIKSIFKRCLLLQ